MPEETSLQGNNHAITKNMLFFAYVRGNHSNIRNNSRTLVQVGDARDGIVVKEIVQSRTMHK